MRCAACAPNGPNRLGVALEGACQPPDAAVGRERAGRRQQQVSSAGGGVDGAIGPGGMDKCWRTAASRGKAGFLGLENSAFLLTS